MALTKKNESQSKSWKDYALLVYIIASALFIVFSFYSGLKNLVYMTGVNQGAQQWYTQALNELAQWASSCNPIPVSLGEQSFELINVDCVSTQTEQDTISTAQ